MKQKTVAVSIFLVVIVVASVLTWRHFSVSPALAATAKRQGYDVAAYADVVALSEKCFERRELLTADEWARAKRYVMSDNDRFRNRAQALLRAQEKSPFRDEAIHLARQMLLDREEHVVAGALVTLFRMGVPDKSELVQRYKNDPRPAVKEMAEALEIMPNLPKRSDGL